MRYRKDESTNILGNFNNGDTVTIDIYKLSDNTKIVDDEDCSEIGALGVFKYNFSQTITEKTEYLWIMKATNSNQMGKIILGGWVDDVELMRKIESNRWIITNNQFIIYDDDGTTPLLTFDLKDGDGLPTESDPKERTPA